MEKSKWETIEKLQPLMKKDQAYLQAEKLLEKAIEVGPKMYEELWIAKKAEKRIKGLQTMQENLIEAQAVRFAEKNFESGTDALKGDYSVVFDKNGEPYQVHAIEKYISRSVHVVDEVIRNFNESKLERFKEKRAELEKKNKSLLGRFGKKREERKREISLLDKKIENLESLAEAYHDLDNYPLLKRIKAILQRDITNNKKGMGMRRETIGTAMYRLVESLTAGKTLEKLRQTEMTALRKVDKLRREIGNSLHEMGKYYNGTEYIASRYDDGLFLDHTNIKLRDQGLTLREALGFDYKEHMFGGLSKGEIPNYGKALETIKELREKNTKAINDELACYPDAEERAKMKVMAAKDNNAQPRYIEGLR